MGPRGNASGVFVPEAETHLGTSWLLLSHIAVQRGSTVAPRGVEMLVTWCLLPCLNGKEIAPWTHLRELSTTGSRADPPEGRGLAFLPVGHQNLNKLFGGALWLCK